MKKLLAMVLTLCLMCGMFSFALAEGDKPTISYWCYSTGDYAEETFNENFVEDALGIEIVINTTPHTEGEAVNLMLASDMPDCGWFPKSTTWMYDQELARTIPVEMVREYCPGMIEQLDQYPIMWAQTLDPEDDTQFLCLPDMYNTYSDLYLWPIYLRYDWIEKLGIDLGDAQIEQITDQFYISDKPLTLDVFTEVLRGFVNGDPDGNGEADTEGLVKNWSDLMGAFGMISNNMDSGDGTPTVWYVDERCKDLLAYVRDLYAEGLIYEEIFTIGWGQDWELINNGKCGVETGAASNYLNSWAATRPPLTLLNGDDPSVKVLMIPGVASNDGEFVSAAYIGKGFGGSNGIFYVRDDVDDEKLATILKMVQFTCFPDSMETSAILHYGEEGVDWNWNEAHDTPIPTENPRKQIAWGLSTQIGDYWRWLTFEELFAKCTKYVVKDEGGLWLQYLKDQYVYDLYSETEMANISNEYSADWGNVRNNYFMGVIMGEKNLDSDWDAYIAELNDYHFDEYMEEMNKAPRLADLMAQFE